jgi:FtsZ-binding cell division protein ZapB
MIRTINCKRILDINNEEVTYLQLTYEPLEDENPDGIKEYELSIAKEIVGLRNEVNQLRIENRKVSEKITDQAKEIAGLVHELRQIKTNTANVFERMTEMLVLIKEVSSND